MARCAGDYWGPLGHRALYTSPRGQGAAAGSEKFRGEPTVALTETRQTELSTAVTACLESLPY
jgi:hypothetical protein